MSQQFDKLDEMYGHSRATAIARELRRLEPYRTGDEAIYFDLLTDMKHYTKSKGSYFLRILCLADLPRIFKEYADRVERNSSLGVLYKKITPEEVLGMLRIEIPSLNTSTKSQSHMTSKGRRKYIGAGSQVGFKSGC